MLNSEDIPTQITYLHQYFTLPSDAGGTRSYEMARRLVAWGHGVDMITTLRSPAVERHGWTQTVEDGIRVHWFPVPYSNAMSYTQRLGAFFRFAFAAARKAASLPCDLVFASSTPLTIALPGVYAARRRNVPMVFEVRDLWPELPIAIGALKGRPIISIARWLEKFAYRNSAQIVALSHGMKSGVLARGYPEQRVHVIPNSADLDLFNVPQKAGLEFRNRFDWLGKRPLVVYTGTLGDINGVEYLVRLAAELKVTAPEVCFLVVGDGKQKSHVRSTAQMLGVLNSNFYMLDSLSKREIPAVLAAADIASSLFIDLPEMWNNSANKFFDALASSTPIAINYRGWQADLIQETDVGLVLDAKDIRQAATHLLNAIHDRDWLQLAGQRARKLAEERFSRDVLAQQLEHVMLDTVADWRSRHQVKSRI